MTKQTKHVNGQVSKKLCQIIGRVHIPAESIHTAGRVYRHFVSLSYISTTALKLQTCKPTTNTQQKLSYAFVY